MNWSWLFFMATWSYGWAQNGIEGRPKFPEGCSKSQATLINVGPFRYDLIQNEPVLLYSNDITQYLPGIVITNRKVTKCAIVVFDQTVTDLAFLRPLYESVFQFAAYQVLPAEFKAISEDIISPRIKHMNVSVIGFPPFVYYLENGGLSGTDINVLDAVAKNLGFTYDLVKESTWMTLDPAGFVIGGTIYSVMKGYSTIGIGDIVVTHQRYQLVDASRYVYQLPFFLVGPKSKPYKPYLNMTKPYTVFTWTIFLISFASYLITIGLVQKFMVVKEHRDPDITKWIISYIGILSVQAAPPSVSTPKSPTLAVLFQIWLVTSFLLVAGYECNLRANIIVKEYEAPIETDVDILDRGVQLHVSKGSIFAPLFRNSPKAVRRTLGEQMDLNGNYYPLNGGLIPKDYEKRIKDNGDVFLGNDMMTRAMFPTFEERHGEQPYRIGRVNFEPDTYSSFVVTKGQRRLRKAVDSVIRGLTEGGIVHQLIKSYIKPQHLVRNDVQEEVLKPFNMEQVFGAFVVFLCGHTLASLVFFVELVAFPREKSIRVQLDSKIIQVQSVHNRPHYLWD